ncbi:hypothetical protein NW756_000667 [Fusarium oxysporum]|nr:hypothetical protein NW763_006183 [Fusarium oxysporum]KAJ4063153.1 hypothetical protein NW753_004616 [Fusarium oxysporum]KAJ4104901.1 hypothetical protein NW756_000667 [Fusarium oxysporum]
MTAARAPALNRGPDQRLRVNQIAKKWPRLGFSSAITNLVLPLNLATYAAYIQSHIQVDPAPRDAEVTEESFGKTNRHQSSASVRLLVAVVGDSSLASFRFGLSKSKHEELVDQPDVTNQSHHRFRTRPCPVNCPSTIVRSRINW